MQITGRPKTTVVEYDWEKEGEQKMNLTWKELEAFGVDWEEFCELMELNVWARNEGQIDDDTDFNLTTEQFKKLKKECEQNK